MDRPNARYRTLSLLLAYPDARLLAALPALEAVLATWPAGGLRSGLQEILAQMIAMPPIRLQETYTAAFDLDPAVTLNLTYHLYRDGEKRSAALARLHALYRDAGWVTTTGELPDYLPLIIEFMAVCPHAHSHDLVRACLGVLESLAAKVRSKSALYAALLELLNDTVRRCEETPAAGKEAASPQRPGAGIPAP